MSVTKTPTSSLTATELLVNRLWYRNKAKIDQFLRGGTQEASTPRRSPITRLPQELVEIIISYFAHDTRTLLSCSMTCYSWYIAAVPHLHHSLTTDNKFVYPTDKYRWPKPLQKSYKLGLLPLVKRLRIRLGWCPAVGFTPELVGKRTLRYFSALTNLQELGIDDLQVSSFMPEIQQLFGHFAPTLRFLALKEPIGSSRQILYLIGLFPNLQDLKLCYPSPREERESVAGADLIPLCVPQLQGRLTLTCFTREKLVKDMIALFGGLRFRRMDLFRVKCVRLLLDACVDTLELLRLYPTDLYENGQAVRRHFNLSRNKSLQTLETTAASITAAGDTASGFLATVLSTVAAPLPLNVVIVYRELDVNCYVCHREKPLRTECVSAERSAANALQHSKRFKVFGEMHKVREFRLVLCADVLCCVEEYAMGTLERIVEAERKKGRLDYLLYEPLVISEVRSPRARPNDECPGQRGKWSISASAL